MIIDCPDCGAKIPDTERKCPVCGSVLDIYAMASSPDLPAEPCPPKPEPVKKKKVSILKAFFRRIFDLILFFLIFFVIVLVVLMTDFKGARTELRNMCMADSGSGSEGDEQIIRVEVKHYILVFLNLIDNGGTEESYIKLEDPREKTVRESTVKKKKERAPVELPPDPPEVEPFSDNSKEYVPETAGK